MILSFIDINGNQLNNTNVSFEYNNISENKTTNENGIIELTGLEEDYKVICYSIKEKKQDFSFKEDSNLTITLECSLSDMIFVVAKQNGDASTSLKVNFKYNGNVTEKRTDSTGQITLKDIPLNTKVKVFQLFNKKEENIEIFTCEKDKAQYFYVAEEIFETADMTFKLVDKNGQLIRSSDLRFKHDNKEFETATNSEGCVTIENIKIGSSVECKQLLFGKSLPWHKFKFDKTIDEYIIHGQKVTIFGADNENYDSQVRMKIVLVNSKSEPIPNAIITLDYNNKTRNKYTNQKGEIIVDDILVNNKIKVSVDVRGNTTDAEFICNEDNEINKVILKTDNNKAILISSAVVVILILAFGLSKIDFKSIFSKKEEPVIIEVVQDSIINYRFTIKEKATNKTLYNAKTTFKYKDSSFIKFSDKNGKINLDLNSKSLPLKINTSLLGYNDSTINFVTDSIATIFLTKNDSFDIAKKYISCGNLTESTGSNITYRTFHMNMDKGRFKLFYNMFSLPDEIEIHNGDIYSISEKTLLYSSEKEVNGIKSFYLNFNSPDSLITIKVEGSDNTTKWLYKVFCPRKL